MKKNFVLLFVSMLSIACSKHEEALDPTSPTPSIDPEEMTRQTVNPYYVPIDWTQAQLLKCDPEQGRYTLSNTDAQLYAGSVLTIDADTMQYIAIVKRVNAEGEKVTIEADRGDLCDLFANTSFILSTDRAQTRSTSTQVITPSEITYTDTEGNRHTIPWEEATRSRSGSRLTGNLWNGRWDLSGNDIYKSNNCRIYLKDALSTIDIDLTLEFSFTPREKVGSTIAGVIEQYRSRALWVKGSVDGVFRTQQTLAMTVGGSTTYDKGYQLIKHGLFNPVSVKFLVAGVPVYVTLNSDLYGGCRVEASGELDFTTGFTDTATGSLGFEWGQSDTLLLRNNFDNRLEVQYPTLSGQGEVKGRAYMFPRIRTLIYGLLGPSFDVKPYAEVEAQGGFKEQLLSSSDDYCAWSLDNYLGVDIGVGFSVSLLNFRNYEASNEALAEFNILHENVYHSPTDLQFHSADSETVRAGQKNRVRFAVYDTDNFLGDTPLTPLPQLVRFDVTGGTLKSKYGIVRNGIAESEWTPESDFDELTATLYTPGGEVIKQVKFGDTLRDYLERLYRDTGGDNWTRKENWMTDKPVWEWEGVTKLDDGTFKLNLNNNNLQGDADLSGCTALRELFCSDNQLSSLNVSGCTVLHWLSGGGNRISSLDASGCTALSILECPANQLTSLDVSGCTKLTTLNCNYNQLTSLNISECTELTELSCDINQFTSLDVSGCTALYKLWCSGNQLTSLDVSRCTALRVLGCEHNRITQEVPAWFKLTAFVHDVRYKYYSNGSYTDNGYGWWYPGEPQKGYHGW